jgi:hypothetical protein
MNTKLVTISVEKDDEEKIKFLKEKGHNVSYICRSAIREAYEKAKITSVKNANLQNN